MRLHSKRTILLLGALVFILLYISLVQSASLNKPDPQQDKDAAFNLEKSVHGLGVPDEAILVQRDLGAPGGHHIIGKHLPEDPDPGIESVVGALEIDSQQENLQEANSRNELKKDQQEEEEGEEEEKKEPLDEDEEEEGGEEGGEDHQILQPGIRNEQKAEVDQEEEEGDGAGDEGENPSGPRDLKLEFPPRKDHDDDIAVDGAHMEVPLKIEDIQPPDHLDAVRMEQDGHLNRDYKKEIFLGNHEALEEETEKEQEKELADVFHKVDVNSDGQLTVQELEDWILVKVREHFEEAAEENEKSFASLDLNKDGAITWKEFHYQFLRVKGYKDADIEEESENYDAISLDPAEKETIIRYKFRWAEADESPQDNKLTLVEFQNFRHPEKSHSMLDKMVEEILESLDLHPHDGIITEEEFAALPPGEDYDELDESDKSWQEDRKREFREMIDKNHDGNVGKEELKNYVDPKNPSHSKTEAENLVELADDNGDGKLSLSEVLENKEMFFGSKMVDTGRSFHDEF